MLLKIGINLLSPILIFLSQVFKSRSSDILFLYIKINNFYVMSLIKRKKPNRILILLPHCLQNPNCKLKIVNSIINCKKCLQCDIGSSLLLAEKYNISAIEVASGGTSARIVVQKIKPEFIIAIACERDLASGIFDIKKIPVYGILNQRPNGPCYFTKISIKELCNILELVTNTISS
jgi:hypothetical protein